MILVMLFVECFSN